MTIRDITHAPLRRVVPKNPRMDQQKVISLVGVLHAELKRKFGPRVGVLHPMSGGKTIFRASSGGFYVQCEALEVSCAELLRTIEDAGFRVYNETNPQTTLVVPSCDKT